MLEVNEDPAYIQGRLDDIWNRGDYKRPQDVMAKGEKFTVEIAVYGDEAALRFISRLRPDHERDVYVDAEARMFLSTDKPYFVPDYIAPRTVKYFVEARKLLADLATKQQAWRSTDYAVTFNPAHLPKKEFARGN